MSKAVKINERLELLLDKVRIAPAGQRQKLMSQVRKLRVERDLALMAAHR